MCSKVETFGVVAVAVLVFAGFALASFPCCSWAQGPGIPATEGPGCGAISSNSPKWTSFTDPESDMFTRVMHYYSGIPDRLMPSMRPDIPGEFFAPPDIPSTNNVPTIGPPPEGLRQGMGGRWLRFGNPAFALPEGMLERSDHGSIGIDETEFIESHFPYPRDFLQ